MFLYRRHLLILLILTIAVSCLAALRARAENEDTHAYLYFYTVDGEEIESLTKRLSTKKMYTFPDPDEYKYLGTDDGSGKLIYNELADEITGIHWQNAETGETYAKGAQASFSPGVSNFYVKSDKPELTGENTLTLSKSELVHLYFYDENGDEIFSLAKDLAPQDSFSLPDPDEYVSSDSDSAGIYWYCEEGPPRSIGRNTGKQYLFSAGQKIKMQAGTYELHIRTDDPVAVSFHYPLEAETYFVGDCEAGALYSRITAKVGDTITMKRSLGAIVWECSFAGWEDEYGEISLAGGETYRIMNNGELTFFAVYEFDEDWNINAKDENETETEKEKEIIVDIDAVNAAGGAGFGAYIDENGSLQISEKRKINSQLAITGIPGLIKTQGWLSPGLGRDDDPNDPTSYKYDKYGRKLASVGRLPGAPSLGHTVGRTLAP